MSQQRRRRIGTVGIENTIYLGHIPSCLLRVIDTGKTSPSISLLHAIRCTHGEGQSDVSRTIRRQLLTALGQIGTFLREFEPDLSPEYGLLQRDTVVHKCHVVMKELVRAAYKVRMKDAESKDYRRLLAIITAKDNAAKAVGIDLGLSRLWNEAEYEFNPPGPPHRR